MPKKKLFFIHILQKKMFKNLIIIINLCHNMLDIFFHIRIVKFDFFQIL